MSEVTRYTYEVDDGVFAECVLGEDFDLAQSELSGCRAANMVLREELNTERLRADTAVADANDAERKLAALREELADMQREFEVGQKNWVEGMKTQAAAEQRNSDLLVMLRQAWVDECVSAEDCRKIDAALGE